MQKQPSRKVLLTAAALVAALVGGVALGAALFARDRSPQETTAGERTADRPADPTTTSIPADVDADRQAASSRASGQVGAPGDPAGTPGDAGALPAVQPANQPVYAYQEADAGRRNTGTVPPPTLPVTVRMSSTDGLVDGQPVTIRVEAKEHSEMYGFEARICRADATFRGLYDFFPTVAGTCAAEPLSPNSDVYLRVQGEFPYQAAEGTIRVGMGSNTFTLEDDRRATVSCDREHPCKLVLMIQVPYGFGFQEFPISYR
ncbi:MAG: hypothetical protein WHS89_11860 [Acidimicrobiales bacterium]